MARLCTHSESEHFLMALDAGTGSVRAVIFDLKGRQILVRRNGSIYPYQMYLAQWNLNWRKTGN